MSFWQIAQCDWTATAELDRYLADSWESFCVTQSHGPATATATIWLRRSTERQPAYAAAPRPRLEHEVVRLARTTAGDAA
jgi:hypothetical protein